ncbi:atp-dependent helicase [Streptomyces xiamenensis]|uniref:Atp-dependent helicase n=1 Tax=Streptomyces xiamenensis TaxID=408015 RepID=A0A0F7G033_9ACTN|nr:atp-dependent helicase [Streptomyces xiamenensis]
MTVTSGGPALTDLLHAAVTAVGGSERPGQIAMAEAVAEAIEGGTHLLAQAGTGTGKSLGYLVPALAGGDRVVVATATLALQRQLVERDLPRTVEALRPLLRRRPEFATLKGRANYLCLHRLHEGAPQEEDQGLFDPPPDFVRGTPIEARPLPPSAGAAAPAASWARICCAFGTGRTSPRPATGTSWPRASPIAPGRRCRSPPGSAWVRASAPTVPNASPRRRASAPRWPMSS